MLGREQEKWAAEVEAAAARTKRLGLVQQEVARCSETAASQASLEEVGFCLDIFPFCHQDGA